MHQAANFDFARAKARRDAGMSSAAKHADDESPGWLESAVQAVREYAMVTADIGKDFTMEEARRDIAHKLPKPPELRAWGAVARICKARGYIIQIPGVYRCAASSNGSPKPVYVSGSAA